MGKALRVLFFRALPQFIGVSFIRIATVFIWIGHWIVDKVLQAEQKNPLRGS